jgi:hypothetical protein
MMADNKRHMGEVVNIVHEAMSVWCAMYAPKECGEKAVEKAMELRDEHGGVLGYIADVESRIRQLTEAR